MARRRSVAEIRRALKRRLLNATQDEIERTARDLRSFAIASAFFDGYSPDAIVEFNRLAKPLARIDVESAIRAHMTRRR